MSLNGFNLLQDSTQPPDIWDQIYDWITKVGRVVVIAVELVVIVAFVTRVVVDTQTKNLQELEQEQAATLVALTPSELEIRDLQDRFTSYKSTRNGSQIMSPIALEIISLLPASAQNISINVRAAQATLSGETQVSEINLIEAALKESSSFSNVQVFQIELTTSINTDRAQARFGIRADIVPERIAVAEKIGT